MTYLLLCDSSLLATGIPPMILTQVNRLSLVYTGQRRHSAFFPLTHFPYKVGLHLDPLACRLGKNALCEVKLKFPSFSPNCPCCFLLVSVGCCGMLASGHDLALGLLTLSAAVIPPRRPPQDWVHFFHGVG